jgi:hypothetical protein
MMKLLMAAFALMSSFAAHAESDWEYEGHKIHIFEMTPMRAMFINTSSEAILPEEYLKDGVYIRAQQNDVSFPKSAEIIKERFARRGIKVVDEVKGAGIAITFSGVHGTFLMSYSEVDYPLPEEQLKWDDEQGRLNAIIAFAPVTGVSLMGDATIRSASGGEKVNSNEIVYKRMSNGIKSATLLRMAIDQWLDRFVPSATVQKP